LGERIRFGDLRLTYRFFNLELNVLLNLRFDSGEEGILCFQQISTGKPIGGKQEIIAQGKQGTVLVDVIKLMDSPERAIPSSVWFERINCLERLRKHSLYLSSLFGFVFLESLSDRKFDSSEFLRGKRDNRSTLHSDCDKLLCEVVKSGSEVVNDIPGNGDGIKRQSGNLLKFVGCKRAMGWGAIPVFGSVVRIVV
jgi:hypothetical protein